MYWWRYLLPYTLQWMFEKGMHHSQPNMIRTFPHYYRSHRRRMVLEGAHSRVAVHNTVGEGHSRVAGHSRHSTVRSRHSKVRSKVHSTAVGVHSMHNRGHNRRSKGRSRVRSRAHSMGHSRVYNTHHLLRIATAIEPLAFPVSPLP